MHNNDAKPINHLTKTAETADDFGQSSHIVRIARYPSPPIDVGKKLLKKNPPHNTHCK